MPRDLQRETDFRLGHTLRLRISPDVCGWRAFLTDDFETVRARSQTSWDDSHLEALPDPLLRPVIL